MFNELYNEFFNEFYIISALIALVVVSSLILYLVSVVKQKKHDFMMNHIKEVEDQKRKDFISNVNHELRTPVNIINGMVSLLLQQSLNEQTTKYIEKIKVANLDIKTLIDSAMDFDKIDRDNVIKNNKSFNFYSFIENLKNDFLPLAEQKGLKLSFMIDEHIPKVVISDEYLLKSICSKLINNAIKFTDKGHVDFKVEFVESNDSVIKLKFYIIDTGIGMDKGKKKQVFRAFNQGDSSKTRTYGGIGVGLFLVEKMLKTLNTKIGILTSLGSGSTFSFPLILEYISDDLSDFDICKDKKVMFVDDDIIIRQIGEVLLKELKTNAMILSSGEEALDNINSTYDLLLLDIEMPGINGIEVAEKINELGYGNVPIIALTGNAEESDLEEYKRVGIRACIAKPIDVDLLKVSIADFFKSKGTNLEFKKIEKSELEYNSEVISFEPSKGLRLLNNDKELYLGILGKFQENYNNIANQISENIEKKDFKAGQIMAHSVKSVAASAGALPLSRMAKDIEFSLKQEEVIDIKEFTSELDKVMIEVKKYLDDNLIIEDIIQTKKEFNFEEFKPLLAGLQESISKNDPVKSKEILKETDVYLFSEEIENNFAELKKAITGYDFKKSSEIIKSISKKLGGNNHG